jgi:hypothetical protein
MEPLSKDLKELKKILTPDIFDKFAELITKFKIKEKVLLNAALPLGLQKYWILFQRFLDQKVIDPRDLSDMKYTNEMIDFRNYLEAQIMNDYKKALQLKFLENQFQNEKSAENFEDPIEEYKEFLDFFNRKSELSGSEKDLEPEIPKEPEKEIVNKIKEDRLLKGEEEVEKERNFKLSLLREGMFLLIVLVGEFFLITFGLANIPLEYSLVSVPNFIAYVLTIGLSIGLSIILTVLFYYLLPKYTRKVTKYTIPFGFIFIIVGIISLVTEYFEIMIIIGGIMLATGSLLIIYSLGLIVINSK